MLYCPACDRPSPDLQVYRCPECSGPLELVPWTRRFPLEAINARPPDMWRYAEALPPLEQKVSLGEPVTPLVPFDAWGLQVLAKCEFSQASGSYKDRGAALLMSYLKSQGVTAAVEDSSGNAGAALAAYAARAGIALQVFCPQSAAAGKLAQISLYGAQLVKVPGPRPQATLALLEHLKDNCAVYASHLWHPLFIEGIATLAYELVEQLEWQAPDAVLCPVGAGSILLGLHRGFQRLVQAQVIPRCPRLIAVQAAKIAPVCRAFGTGSKSVEPATPTTTLAEGIALPAPVRDGQVLNALRASGGSAIAVAEEAITAGLRALGAKGFCIEPTAAVVWDGLRQAKTQNLVSPQERVVVILSGHGLKASQTLTEILPS